jgi:hypothetical protein
MLQRAGRTSRRRIAASAQVASPPVVIYGTVAEPHLAGLPTGPRRNCTPIAGTDDEEVIVPGRLPVDVRRKVQFTRTGGFHAISAVRSVDPSSTRIAFQRSAKVVRRVRLAGPQTCQRR